MSILIKGMKMPKNCNECKFGTWSNLHQTACCKRHDFDPCFEDHSREYMEKRADFCPLVEIPEPHGEHLCEDEVVSCLEGADWINEVIRIFLDLQAEGSGNDEHTD